MILSDQTSQIETDIHSLAQKRKSKKSKKKKLGINVPTLRAYIKDWYKQKNPDTTFCIQLAHRLWQSSVFEVRLVSLYLLEEVIDDLGYSHLEMLEEMVETATSWAQVDEIGTQLVGNILLKDRTGLLFLPIWANAENLWVRRLAIISQIPLFRQGKGNMTIFADVVKPQLNEDEDWSSKQRFYIRKAIGWSLRERTKSDPDSVIKFVNMYGHRMHSLSVREAIRNLEDVSSLKSELKKVRE